MPCRTQRHRSIHHQQAERKVVSKRGLRGVFFPAGMHLRLHALLIAAKQAGRQAGRMAGMLSLRRACTPTQTHSRVLTTILERGPVTSSQPVCLCYDRSYTAAINPLLLLAPVHQQRTALNSADRTEE